MKINIASVLKNSGALMSFSGVVDMGKFEFMGSNLSFESPVSVSGNISNLGGTLEISAKITGEYSTECSRCCEVIKKKIDIDLSESINEDFSGADEECFSISGTVLDIEGAVKAYIYNNIPLKFLCSENCKGLCPVCGTNLNIKECNCDTADYDPRFAIFRNLQ